MSSQISKCFVINMPSSVERRDFMTAQLQEQGLDFEIFPATNGRALTEEERKLCDLSEWVELPVRLHRKLQFRAKLTPAEFGCALSHLRLYQHIVDQGLERALVLEDDAIIKPDLKVALENLDVITTPWDVVHFSDHCHVHNFNLLLSKKFYFGPNKEFYFKRVGMHNVYLDLWRNYNRPMLLTHGYVVTRHACEVLLQKGYPVRMPSDWLLGLFSYNELKLFRVAPDLHFVATSGIPSTIGTDRVEHEVKFI